MTKFAELHQAIIKTGYYPALVTDAITAVLAGEETKSFVLQHETTFDHDKLHRHLTVVALTPSRLIVSHTDEAGPDATRNYSGAVTSTEAVQLNSIASVVVQRVVSEPAEYGTARSQTQEIVITIGWGAVNRIDLGPAACDDPQCEAEHGYAGTTSNDDLQIRVSLAADGQSNVEQAWAFAGMLSEVTSLQRR